MVTVCKTVCNDLCKGTTLLQRELQCNAAMCKHKGAGLHLKCQKEQVRIMQTMEGELLLVLDSVLCDTASQVPLL